MLSLIVILIIFLALALLAGGFIGWHGRKFIQRIETLEQIAKRRKLPYPAMAGLEDALALIDDSQYEGASVDQVITHLLTILQKEIAVRKYTDARFAQVQDILKVIRADAQGYDADFPSKAK